VSAGWRPYREPLRVTLARTGTIAAVVGLAVAVRRGGGLRWWIVATILALWPSFGGHWVEVFFLNWLRPRLSAGRWVQTPARIGVWFVGGIVLWVGVRATAAAMNLHPPPWPTLWSGGVVFIAIELVAHLVLHLRGVPNVYDGRG
jgi:hypothetical protein